MLIDPPFLNFRVTQRETSHRCLSSTVLSLLILRVTSKQIISAILLTLRRLNLDRKFTYTLTTKAKPLIIEILIRYHSVLSVKTLLLKCSLAPYFLLSYLKLMTIPISRVLFSFVCCPRVSFDALSE